MIANHRTELDIANHIGAERIIYQKLEDLEAACRECINLPAERLRPTEFEIGVFCGSYVTPVDEEYFTHLDYIRGKAQERKRAKQALVALANGMTEPTTIQKAPLPGTLWDKNGNDVSAQFSYRRPSTDLTHMRADSPEDRLMSPKREMDIALHNMADFESERR